VKVLATATSIAAGRFDAFGFAARHAGRTSPREARRRRMVEVIETLRRSVAIEMDMRMEDAALSEMAANTKADRISGCPPSIGITPSAMGSRLSNGSMPRRCPDPRQARSDGFRLTDLGPRP